MRRFQFWTFTGVLLRVRKLTASTITLMAPITRSALKKSLQNDCGNSFVRNFDGKSVSISGVRGLVNLNVTCYLNSVIQAIMHTPLVRQYFLSDNHKCSHDLSMPCQMCVLSQIFKEYYSDNVLAPMSLDQLFEMVLLEAPFLDGTVEQDAHEFYITYLHLLHLSCVRSYDDLWLGPSNLCSHLMDTNNCDCIIDQLYLGIQQSNLTCLKCRKVSAKQEIFNSISLELNVADKRENIYNCLGNYVRSESLDDSSKLFCSNCQSNEVFEKSLQFVSLPKLLNVNFKLFGRRGRQQRKLSKRVIFPFELDMKPYLGEFAYDADLTYELAAVITHIGSINKGHYVAFVRHSVDVWLLCDDDRISAVSPETVLASQAYILVYQRKD